MQEAATQSFNSQLNAAWSAYSNAVMMNYSELNQPVNILNVHNHQVIIKRFSKVNKKISDYFRLCKMDKTIV